MNTKGQGSAIFYHVFPTKNKVRNYRANLRSRKSRESCVWFCICFAKKKNVFILTWWRLFQPFHGSKNKKAKQTSIINSGPARLYDQRFSHFHI